MHEEFSRARIEKDKNFDGKFFFGVQTTGIFCRPSCPSPVAKEEHVQYFESMFEALEQGFRPCLRCRPDVEVEYYNGNACGSSTVNNALKMIYNGYLSYHTIKELAQELHVSDRHLRKLFVNNLGVPPVKIARYHKTLFAKKLLISSNYSITDIAFASGFGSIRQFNDAFKDIFEKTPTTARKELKIQSTSHSNTTLFLKYDKSFDFLQILNFMSSRIMKGVEIVTDNEYSRTFRTKNSEGFFTVKNNPGKSALELSIVCNDIKCFMEIYNKVRRMFDLDTDFTDINARFAKDKTLSKGMINGHVPRLPIAFDPYEFIIRAILGQQVTIKAATTIAARIANATQLTTSEAFPEGLNFFFPNQKELISLDLNGLGMTKTRQKTIQTVTQAVIDNAVKLTSNQTLATFDESFSALKGIGSWTVNYVAMRGLGLLDCFPASDLGVIKALTIDGKKTSQKEILKKAEKWSPYRTYATLCLWNSTAKEN